MKIRYKVVRIFVDTFAERTVLDNLSYEEANTYCDDIGNSHPDYIHIVSVDFVDETPRRQEI